MLIHGRLQQDFTTSVESLALSNRAQIEMSTNFKVSQNLITDNTSFVKQHQTDLSY